MTFSEALSAKNFVLVDFYATWCEPCKWVEPILKDVMISLSEKIHLHKVDIDKLPDIAKENHVLSVPTLMLFKDGKEIWRMRGFDTAPALISTLGKFL